MLSESPLPYAASGPPAPAFDALRFIAKGLLASLLICTVIFLGELYAVSSYGYGGDMVVWITMMAAFPALYALFAAPVCLLIGLFSRHRARFLSYALVSAFFLAAFSLTVRLAGRERTAAFQRLTVHSRPLVDAIIQYTKDTGAPPAALAALVPNYLPEVPRTGMPAYPDYEYATNPARWDGNPWVLYINTPSGGIDFDLFLYFPLQNYPERGYGGSLQRIETWAYVHE